MLHIDMDAFFVSVELLDRPELRGQPVVVGSAGGRGVVAAASYEARAYGVFSAMSSVQARRLCPHAVFLDGRHARYGEVSARVMSIFRSFTPLVEPISLDEAFLDVRPVRRLHGSSVDIATTIRSRVLDEEGLQCSVGIAPSKFVAKLASEFAKPRASVGGPIPGIGIKVVGDDELLAFLHPLPVNALWGVGPVTLGRLQRLGIGTIGQLAAMPPSVLITALGKSSGQHLHALANGIDEREVQPNKHMKSVGHEETFSVDHHQHATLERELVRLSDSVASRLRSGGVAGRTITLKIRFHDFQTVTRSITLGGATDSAQIIVQETKALLAKIDPSAGVRLIGVSVSGLAAGASRQLSLDELEVGSWEDANLAVDAIRDRFGIGAIGPATLTSGPDREVR